MLQFLKRLAGMPVTAEDFIKRGDWHVEAGDRAAAIRDYRQAHAAEPTNSRALCALASAVLDDGDAVQSVQWCDEALRLDGACAQAHYLRGIARRNQGDLENAAVDLQRAAELDPHHANAQAALKSLKQIRASRDVK